MDIGYSQNLNCALSNNHPYQDSIQLNCGHHVCGNCFISESNNGKMKCNICNIETDKSSIESILNQNIEKLFKVAFESMKGRIFSCKDAISERDSKIDSHVEFMKDEIRIRVESLKAELDKLYDSFDSELEEVRVKWKEDSKIDTSLIEQSESELIEVEAKMKTQEFMNKENLYYYHQFKIKEFQDILDKFRKNHREWRLMESETVLNKDDIGEITFENEFDAKIMNNVRNHNYKSHDVRSTVYDLCTLPGGNLLLVSYCDSKLLVYDDQMRLVKTITRIGDIERLDLMCAAHDGVNSIFLTDFRGHKIMKTDFDYNKLASFGDGKGSDNSHLAYPVGICYYKDHIFVCDRDNSRILKLDSNLIYEESYRLDHSPYYIKNIKNIAMIRTSDSKILFYDLDNFSFIRKYENRRRGIIGHSRVNFYEYIESDRLLLCYNEKGEFSKEIQTNGLGIKESNFFGAITTFNSKMFIVMEKTLTAV